MFKDELDTSIITTTPFHRIFFIKNNKDAKDKLEKANKLLYGIRKYYNARKAEQGEPSTP